VVQIYPVGATAATEYAAQFMSRKGLDIVDHPTPEVTHLLLDVPSFGPGGLLRSGGRIDKILETIPQYITVVGGRLEHPSLEGYKTWDLLQNEAYLTRNAAITADSALQVAAPLLTTAFSQTPTLVIGWGRIGKCLARMLHGLGCPVTVAARKEKDLAMLHALGYSAADPGNLNGAYRLIFNTAPEPVLTKQILSRFPNCVKIDLASRKGLEGEDVVWARGLPGIYAPESSGRLIADTILQLLKEET